MSDHIPRVFEFGAGMNRALMSNTFAVVGRMAASNFWTS
jgi:hypothetical protein